MATATSKTRYPPPSPEVLRGYGLQEAGRIAEAEQVFMALLRRDRRDYYALHQLGLICCGRKQYAEAVLLLATAVEVRPRAAEALCNLGLALHGLTRHEEAVAACDAALAIAPNHAAAHHNRGNALADLDRHAEAAAAHGRAVALQPDDAESLYGLGNALRELRRHDEALAAYRRALELAPGRSDVRFNIALTQLLTGALREGFAGYDHRLDKPEFAELRGRFPTPAWTGEAPVAGRTVLLHPEQGMGDVIQCMRYGPLLAAQGARVIAAVTAPLLPLLAGMPDIEAVVWDRSAPPAHDLHCPYLSLPRAFGTTLETIPATVPYLAAPPDRVNAWEGRLAALPRPRVGIAWAGNPGFANDRHRSIPLSTLAPLLAADGVQFVSLQRDLRHGDETALQRLPNLVQLGEELRDFADTAAVIAALDLVISVDTAVAHLAGALGKPVWILLPYSPDWRWMLDREDSPWYPTARLFRQPRTGDWRSVVARLGEALQAFSGR
ncbi:MAG: glycosyltransferase family protein [Rhodoplanes sp.]|uniref:tetratricopeptide repeat-containing glycosyltransferase family protein n=1 Tax=Rhodoplanes sp. TaxID=1968906 RepID=UPI00184D3EB6|nr:tetratricopeptide repeat-containing glycosyltransferase family protein [Rhodoplanes sp.]NVO15103.1 glycosyltransferase family protein [Rhodoplanes sp.]